MKQPLSFAVRSSARPTVVRWLIITAVLTGVIAMHVLSAHDDGGHGPMIEPAAEVSDLAGPVVGLHMSSPMPEMPQSMVMPTDSGDHGMSMASCILFLIVGAGTLLLALAAAARRRGLALPRPTSNETTAVAPRGPPLAGHPRISLCVLRV